jgi:hypothetical protein
MCLAGADTALLNECAAWVYTCSPLGGARRSQGDGAAQQSVAPVEAREWKMLHAGPIVIDVRFAGERCCSADCGPKRTDPIGTGRRYNPSYG